MINLCYDSQTHEVGGTQDTIGDHWRGESVEKEMLVAICHQLDSIHLRYDPGTEM